MFEIRSFVQRGDSANGIIHKDKTIFGGLYKDEKKLHINLSGKLSLHETIELLKVINGLKEDFYLLEIEINIYIKK